MIEILLELSVFLIIYNYLFYPVAINIASKVRSDPHLNKIDLNFDLPTVSFIIAAYNEEKVIERKIKNTFELDYPKAKFQFIIVSDGSADATHKIASRYKKEGLLVLHQPERGGKSAALNRASKLATNEIIIFSDANNDFSKNAIRELVKHFSDPVIGAVTGAKHIYANSSRESSVGDGLYWKYEAFIKKAESYLGSITAAEGEILAVRKKLLKPIDPSNINDDAAITFDIVKSGFRILYEENALSQEEASTDLVDDINVKIRMTAGGFQTIANEFSFLFPPRNWFSFTFISHKVLRWITPHLMIVILLANLFLLEQNSFRILLAGQIIFYGTALYGWLNRNRVDLGTIFYVPMYFTIMNIALFRGFLRYLTGGQKVTWEKASR
jgi:cellulose synthase/poly-beta-1,6-N-acetylglucosamine synthase-like glycosyltransferase